MSFILQWIDIIWLGLAFAVVHKEQRFLALACIAGCMVMMRLQVELMGFIGFPNGLLNFMSSYVFFRGLAVYSAFYGLYLVLAHYSPGSKGAVFTVASIGIFFAAFFVSAIVMVL